jgi:hypothetical protein
VPHDAPQRRDLSGVNHFRGIKLSAREFLAKAGCLPAFAPRPERLDHATAGEVE